MIIHKHINQWFPTFDGLWPPSTVSQHLWSPARLENWLQVHSQEFALGGAVLDAGNNIKRFLPRF